MRCYVKRAYCHTPLHVRRNFAYNHLITSDINRSSGYIVFLGHIAILPKITDRNRWVPKGYLFAGFG